MTKADGTFRFEAAAEEGNRIRVEAPAFATQERQPVRAGALARPVTLALGQVLRGTVTLADRRTPAPGALVRFEGRTQTTRWVEARADGAFLLDGAPREAGSLVADGGDRGRASAVLAQGTAAEPVAIALAPTATLAGRVVDAADGKALAGVRIVARGPRAGSSSPARARTAATRCAACRPRRTASPPRTTASCRGPERSRSPPGRRRRRTSRSPAARRSRVAWWTRRAGPSKARR